MLRALWFIPILPFGGFVLNGFLGARLGKKFVTLVGVGTVGIALLCSVAAVNDVAVNLKSYEGLESSGLKVDLAAGRADLTVWEGFPSGNNGGGGRWRWVRCLRRLDLLPAG